MVTEQLLAHRYLSVAELLEKAVEEMKNKEQKVRGMLCLHTKKFWKAAQQNVEIPTGMTLQKFLSKTGGQIHFKNSSGKKKPKALNTKKTKKRVKRRKQRSDNLMTFGGRMLDVRTLEDMVR